MKLNTFIMVTLALACAANTEREWLSAHARQGHVHLTARLDIPGCHLQTPLALQIENTNTDPDDVIVAVSWDLVIYRPDPATEIWEQTANSKQTMDTMVAPGQQVTWCYPLPALPEEGELDAMTYVVSSYQATFMTRVD